MMRLLATGLMVVALGVCSPASEAAPDQAEQAAPVRTGPNWPEAVYDSVAPDLPEGFADGVLIVSKTNGYRHVEHIPHSNEVLATIAGEMGRVSFQTENAAVFNDEQLAQVDLVVLNSTSGDWLTEDQSAAFERYVENGGNVVALHAAGDSSYDAPWYVDAILGTTFIGHPFGVDRVDHIQSVRLVPAEPLPALLDGVEFPWSPVDELYSFSRSPEQSGMSVIARLDEETYRVGDDLAMGEDHPIMWTNPAAPGRIFYSALGHTPESYDDPHYRRILTNAIAWALEESR